MCIRDRRQLQQQPGAVVDRLQLPGAPGGVKPGDEPPYPERGLRPMVEAMMKIQGRLGYEGDLHLDATVDPDGRVSAVKVLRSPDSELSRLAATVLVDTPFKPALCGGQPCRMEFPVRQVLKRGP